MATAGLGQSKDSLGLSVNLSGIHVTDMKSPRSQQPHVPGTLRQTPTTSGRANLSYGRKQKAFENFKVDPKKIEARREVQEKARGDILERNRPEWNNSITPRDRNPISDRNKTHTLSRGQSFIPKHNFRAEVLPQPSLTTRLDIEQFHVKGSRDDDYNEGNRDILADSLVQPKVQTSVRHPTSAEMSVNPALAEKKTWNDTTTFDEKAHEEREKQLTARGNQQRKQRSIPNYQTPIAREEAKKEALREHRRMEAIHGVGYEDRWQREREEWEEVKQKVSEAQARQSRNAVLKSTHHPGAWEYNKFQGRHAWSCCMNEGRDSVGCEKVTRNPNKWNFASVL